MHPATKAVPKELLPVGRQPALQWAIDEALSVGIDHLVVVSSPRKPAIAEYLADLSAEGSIDVVYQQVPAGLGDAVRIARDYLESESFAVLLPDEVLLGSGRLLSAMLDEHARTGRSNVGLLRVNREEISSYGCAVVDDRRVSRSGVAVSGCVEKPAPSEAPSTFALSGRYVLGPDVLSQLDFVAPGTFEEVQLTDALDRAARRGGIDGSEVEPADGRFDVGNWDGWLAANVQLFSQKESRPIVLDMSLAS
jgi:UTP--glucose-1-phosphate uridylyltransferase